MPAPLLWLLVAVGLLGLTWSFVTPAWQAPDENSHFAYVQSLGERFELPGDPGRAIFSTEQATAVTAINADQVAGVPETKPEWSPEAYERWRAEQARLPDAARDDGGGPNPAAGNPPLYYLFASVPYKLASGGDIFMRILAVRIAGLIWPLLLVVGTWLLAGELFTRDRTLQLASASLAGLLPMVSFISASISPDGMLYATWTFVVWLGVRALRRGLDIPTAAALGASVGVALVTKATSYALLPAVGLALMIGLWRARRGPVSRLLGMAGSAALALAATVGVWTLVARLLDRAASGQLVGNGADAAALDIKQLGSYVWQFYFPRLPFLEPFPSSTGLPVYDVFSKQAWGAFGWLEVGLAEPVYVALALLALGVSAAAAVAVWRTRRSVDPWLALFFVLLTGTLLAGLHWTEYHYVLGGNGNFMQGRYLFPLIGLGGAAFAKALTLVAPAGRAPVVAGVIGLLVVLQLYGLGLVLERYYA